MTRFRPNPFCGVRRLARLGDRPDAALRIPDAAHALEPGARRTAKVIPAAWLDPSALHHARHAQEIWDGATPEQRQTARARLKAIGMFLCFTAAGRPATESYAAAGNEFGMSGGTVRKWHYRYRGFTPIERLVSLLDAAARQP